MIELTRAATVDGLVRDARHRGLGYPSIAALLTAKGYTAADLHLYRQPGCTTIHATLVRRYWIRMGEAT